jgi:transcriptional regulator with XRE-family HTH domain
VSTIEDGLDHRLSVRLRAEREQRGWSLADLAERSGVSRAMISKVERGESSPTATLLGRLSGAFGVTLSQLLARAEAAGGRLARRADQSSWTDPETGFHRRALTPAGEAAPVELVWGELPPGAEIDYPAAAYAFIDDEQVVVVDGVLELRQGPATYRLEAGDCLRFGPPEETRFRNPGRKPCTYLLSVLRAR